MQEWISQVKIDDVIHCRCSNCRCYYANPQGDKFQKTDEGWDYLCNSCVELYRFTESFREFAKKVKVL